jgi:sulfopyruvate decarboxylase subunit beta
MSMKRDECFAALAPMVPDDIVVSTYTSAFDWMAARDHALNFLSVGPMGLASSSGLGLALGRPDKRVVVLDGDGSLLMNLGTLVSIAAAAPTNLVHCVVENGTYEANGGHPIPNKDTVDFAGLAKAAGFKHTSTISSLEQFKAEMPKLLNQPGPTFVCLKVEPGGQSPHHGNYPYIHGPETRERFRTGLQAA